MDITEKVLREIDRYDISVACGDSEYDTYLDVEKCKDGEYVKFDELKRVLSIVERMLRG